MSPRVRETFSGAQAPRLWKSNEKSCRLAVTEQGNPQQPEMLVRRVCSWAAMVLALEPGSRRLHPLSHSALTCLLSCMWTCRPRGGTVHTACLSPLRLLRRRETSPGSSQKEQTPMLGPRSPDPARSSYTGRPYLGAAPAFSWDSVPQRTLAALADNPPGVHPPQITV